MLARILGAALVAATAAWPQASPPSLLSLQGRLTDNAGQPITSTQRDLRVEFWTLAVGGVSLGNSTVVDPAIANGIYAVTVTAPAGVFAGNAAVFMEMAVGSGAAGADGAFEVLSPRTRVLASAYALNADTLDGRDSSFFTQASTGFVQNGNSFGALATLGTNDAFGLAFETVGVERARLDSSGNLGLGTTAPDARLDVHGNLHIHMAPTDAGLVFGDDAPVDQKWHLGYWEPSILPPSGGLVFTETGVADGIITMIAGGNVGIGTLTPASQLSLGTSGSLADGLTFGPSGTAGIYTDASGWLGLTNQYGVRKLTLFDSYARADENFIVEGMLRGSGGNTPVRIDSGLNVLAGNVGINTGAPAYRLDVNGPARAVDGVRGPLIFSSTTAPAGTWQHPGPLGTYALIPGMSVSFTVNVPSTLDIVSTSLVSNGTLGGATYTKVFVDGVGASDAAGDELYGGYRNPSAGNVVQFSQAANNFNINVAAGAHTVEVRCLVDGGLAGSGVWNGFLRVMAFPQ